MKKYLIPIFILGAATLFATSCEKKLEIAQKGVISMEDFYQTDEDAEAAMVAAYDKMAQQLARANGESIISPFIMLFNLPGDDIYAAGEFYGDNDFAGEINDFRFGTDAQLVTSMYKGYYGIIYNANLVIDNFKDADSAVKKRVVAEARVMRAFCHMMLAIGWDCPPLVDHVLGAAERPYNCNTDPENPMTHEELLEWCAKECLEAVPDLRERANTGDKDATTYITKGFANFVAGKAYVFANNMAAAKAPLKAVISSGKYALVPSNRIRETFHIAGEGNEEIIFATNIRNNMNLGDWGGKIQKTVWMQMDIWGWRTDHWSGKPNTVKGGWGLVGVREDFAEALIANDGFDSPRRKAWIAKYDPEILYDEPYPSDNPWWKAEYTEGEKDADGNVHHEGEPKRPEYYNRGRYVEKTKDTGKKDDKGNPIIDTTFTDDKTKDLQRGIASYLYGQSEYLHNKRHTDPADMDFWYSTLNTLVARYAEVLLLYAEACAVTNDNDGLQYLQAIQNRAGSKHVSGSLSLAEVQNEKRFEMFMEGCRWPDQVRWGLTSSLENNGKQIPYMYDQKFADDVNKTTPRTTKTDNHVIYLEYTGKDNQGKQVGFVKGKHEHFPFPGSAAIAINPNLTQNPNW